MAIDRYLALYLMSYLGYHEILILLWLLTIAGTSLVLWNRVVFDALVNTTIMIAVFLFLITGCYLKIYLTLETSKWCFRAVAP